MEKGASGRQGSYMEASAGGRAYPQMMPLVSLNHSSELNHTREPRKPKPHFTA